MGKKSKRNPHQVQGPAIDSYGNRLNESKTSETKPDKTKPTLKNKHEVISDQHDAIPMDKKQKIKNQVNDDESSRKRSEKEFDESEALFHKDSKSSKKYEYDQNNKKIETSSSKLKSSKDESRYVTDENLSEESGKEPDVWDDYKNYENQKGKDFKSKSDRQKSILLRVISKKGNLFDAPETSSLAHCVAEDLQMGAGIAVEFRDRFRKTGYLADLKVKTGGVAVLKNNNRFIYYLITKKFSKSKPTINSLKSSLIEMAKHVEKNKVRELAMPKIGSGLDRLDWNEVLNVIHDVFLYIDVEITVYEYDGVPMPDITPRKTPVVKHVNLETSTISGTAFLFLSSTSGYETMEMKMIDRQRSFLREFKLQGKNMGSVVRILSKSVNEVVYGLICKLDNKILFSEFENCLIALKNLLHKDQYVNIGILGFESENLDMYHIMTLLKHYIPSQVTIWVYWKGEIPIDFQ